MVSIMLQTLFNIKEEANIKLVKARLDINAKNRRANMTKVLQAWHNSISNPNHDKRHKG